MIKLRAFTLLETLVAVAVMLMALTGPFTIAQQSLKSAYYARDQVTAYYLAQEGIEFVRAVRDQNYLEGIGWLDVIGPTCIDIPCLVDFPNFTYAPCTGPCQPLLISSSGGLFNHDSGDPSKFTRQVLLTPVVGNPDTMVVSVTIAWTSAGVSRTFTLQERIFDWL